MRESQTALAAPCRRAKALALALCRCPAELACPAWLSEPSSSRTHPIRGGPSSLTFEKQDVVRFRLTPLRPGFHKLATLVEDVRPAMGPLNLGSDLAPHRLLDH